jgi:hypothetical protein
VRKDFVREIQHRREPRDFTVRQLLLYHAGERPAVGVSWFSGCSCGQSKRGRIDAPLELEIPESNRKIMAK